LSSAPLPDAARTARHAAARPHAVAWNRTDLVPWAIGSLFAGLYSALSLLRYQYFVVPSWDLGIFTQAVRSYARGHAPVADIKGPGFNVLGDHFSPIMAVLALPYRAFPTAGTLLVAQAVLLGLSCVPVGRLAVRRFGTVAGSAVALAYGLSWGLQWAVESDVHEVAFAVPLLAFSLEAFLEQRWRRSVAWALPLLLVKEDLGFTVAVLGLLLVAKGQRRLGVVTSLVGVVGSVVTLLVVVPRFAEAHRYAYFGQFGTDTASSGLGSVLAPALHNPLTLVSPGAKLVTLFMVALIAGGVCLRSPLLLLAVPTLFWRFASVDPLYWGTHYHYSAVLMPIVFMAFIDGLTRLRAGRWALGRRYATVAIPVVTTVAVMLTAGLPLRALLQPGGWDDGRRQHAQAALAVIPSGAAVETDLGLMSHLVSRDRVYWLGQATGVSPDYLAVDSGSGWSPPPAADLPAYAESLHPGSRYQLIWSQGGFSVLQREPSQ
jgi:uncharacterized membrane protein